MSAADAAIHPLAEGRLLERRDMFGSRLDLLGLRLPETEGIDRAALPRTAGTAMTITHGFRRTGNLKRDSTAEAASNMAHDFSP